MATGRRDLTWLACDALAVAGRKPSIASVREWTIANHGRKQGSDTDTQADINAWYALLLAMKQEKLTVAGLPEDVAVLARALWVKANEAASEALREHRALIDDELAVAQQAAKVANDETIAATARATATSHALDVARESIRRLEDIQSTLHAAAQAIEIRHAAQLQTRDDNAAALERAATQKDADHATRVIELDGLRRHALMQIEEARAESRQWKSESERVLLVHQATIATERQTSARLQAELAGASGRLSAVEEALSAATARSTTLEATLLQARDAEASERRLPVVKKRGTQIPRKIPAFHRRKA